jgi:hypothetical protein
MPEREYSAAYLFARQLELANICVAHAFARNRSAIRNVTKRIGQQLRAAANGLGRIGRRFAFDYTVSCEDRP